MPIRSRLWSGVAVLCSVATTTPVLMAQPGDEPSSREGAMENDAGPRASELIAKATAYLKSRQDASGGWRTEGTGPKFPAITGLVVRGMADGRIQPGVDPAIDRAVAYMLATQKPDGGIYDSGLPSYNTSICVSSLAAVDSAEARAAVKRAAQFLRGLQFSENPATSGSHAESASAVDRSHPFYGGVGYGRHGRPDLSNLGWMLEALHDAGVEGSDEAFQRALVFLQRTQMLETTPDGTTVNDMDYAKGSHQGGFIYSTSVNQDRVGEGQSMSAGMIEETLDDGTKVSRLRCYGSMTYAGFKSYLYADLPREDARVQAAMSWIRSNYTVDENPGMGKEGLYYYYVVMAKALSSWGEPELMVRAGEPDESGVPSKAGDVYKPTRWADDLVRQLAELQQPDGSFTSVHERWMENDPILITAYALNALRYAEKYQ